MNTIDTIIIVVGIIAAVFVAVRFAYFQKISENWITVTGGKVIESRIITNQPEANPVLGISSASSNNWTYEARIVYTYTIEGKEYTSNNIMPGGLPVTAEQNGKYPTVYTATKGYTNPPPAPKSITEIIDRFPVGKTIDVFVDQKKYENSALITLKNEMGSNYNSTRIFVVLSIVGLIALSMIIAGFYFLKKF